MVVLLTTNILNKRSIKCTGMFLLCDGHIHGRFVKLMLILIVIRYTQKYCCETQKTLRKYCVFLSLVVRPSYFWSIWRLEISIETREDCKHHVDLKLKEKVGCTTLVLAKYFFLFWSNLIFFSNWHTIWKVDFCPKIQF